MTEFLRVFVAAWALIGASCLVPWLLERRGRISREAWLRALHGGKASW